MRLRVLSLNAWALPPPVGQRVHERLSLVLRALPALECDIALFRSLPKDGTAILRTDVIALLKSLSGIVVFPEDFQDVEQRQLVGVVDDLHGLRVSRSVQVALRPPTGTMVEKVVCDFGA